MKLTERMEAFITEITERDNNLGYLPENIESQMTDAAFAVLYAVVETNEYLKREDLI